MNLSFMNDLIFVVQDGQISKNSLNASLGAIRQATQFDRDKTWKDEERGPI